MPRARTRVVVESLLRTETERIELVTTFDIIPDIHAQSGKLRALLGKLGYRSSAGSWRSPYADRKIVFLGDFIDRGPDNSGVLQIVRGLQDADLALAVMGNHELNAIHFHTADPDSGKPLRQHSPKNMRQHASFLSEFPIGDPRTQDALDWMKTLPLFLDLDHFRAVHACWHQEAIYRLQGLTPSGILSDDQLRDAADRKSAIYADVDVITTGPEYPLPQGYTFNDKNGESRNEVRIAWWRRDAVTWRDAAISVPDLSDIPDIHLPDEACDVHYPENAKPVFFGHYWLEGKPLIASANTCCLDCSAGTDGPLIAYSFTPDQPFISLDRVISSATQ